MLMFAVLVLSLRHLFYLHPYDSQYNSNSYRVEIAWRSRGDLVEILHVSPHSDAWRCSNKCFIRIGRASLDRPSSSAENNRLVLRALQLCLVLWQQTRSKFHCGSASVHQCTRLCNEISTYPCGSCDRSQGGAKQVREVISCHLHPGESTER